MATRATAGCVNKYRKGRHRVLRRIERKSALLMRGFDFCCGRLYVSGIQETNVEVAKAKAERSNETRHQYIAIL